MVFKVVLKSNLKRFLGLSVRMKTAQLERRAPSAKLVCSLVVK